MKQYSTREAAKKIGIHLVTLQEHIAAGKVPAPPVTRVGGVQVRLWTDRDIERVRETLPKIANGRKTRYQKLREKERTQPTGAALQKKRKPKKK
jgi:hypothetical protein